MADYHCEICHGQGKRHPVECHEVWEYNEKAHIQTLKRLIALCPACHEVKHIGLAQMRGRFDNALEHLRKVNGMTKLEALQMVQQAFKVWDKQSNHLWTLDISWLKEKGIVIPDKD